MVNDPHSVSAPFFKIIGEDGSVFGHHALRLGRQQSDIDFKINVGEVIKKC